MKVVLHRQARAELQAAASWYGDVQMELQLRFEQNVTACIDRLAVSPNQFPRVAETFRRALVEVFPYEVFFEVLETRIKVLAIAHSSREPFYWVKRSSGGLKEEAQNR